MKDNMLQSQYNQRALKDRLARYFVSLGGISVIIAILLIFFYLLSVVIPMFESADIKKTHSYAAPGEGKTIMLGLEEQGAMAVRFTEQGEAIFLIAPVVRLVYEKNYLFPVKLPVLPVILIVLLWGLQMVLR